MVAFNALAFVLDSFLERSTLRIADFIKGTSCKAGSTNTKSLFPYFGKLVTIRKTLTKFDIVIFSLRTLRNTLSVLIQMIKPAEASFILNRINTVLRTTTTYSPYLIVTVYALANTSNYHFILSAYLHTPILVFVPFKTSSTSASSGSLIIDCTDSTY